MKFVVVFWPKPWLAKGRKILSKIGHMKPLAKRSRMKCGGRHMMWVQQLLQFEGLIFNWIRRE